MTVFDNTPFMSGKFYEFVHVSELLQTVFGLTASLLVVAQALMIRHSLWTDMLMIRENEADDYDKWLDVEAIRRGITLEGVEDQNSMVRNVQEGTARMI